MHEEEKSAQGIVFQRVFLILTRVATLCVCVCVFIQVSHIRKFSAVFLHGFSRTEVTAALVTGLRRPPSAACAEGCVAGMCPYCFIAFLFLPSFGAAFNAPMQS